jgi:hypothetical protein
VDPAPFLDAKSWRSKRNIADGVYQGAGAMASGIAEEAPRANARYLAHQSD